MTRPPPLLLALLLPLLGLAFAAVFITLATLYQLKGRQAEAQQNQRQTVGLLNEATRLNAEMASIQQRISDVLKKADTGRMDEAAVYRAHSEVVDALAPLGQKVEGIATQAQALTGDAGTTAALRRDFEEYRNAAIQATDIAAIDPPTAGDHIAAAQLRFIAVSEHTHRIGHDLGRLLERQGAQAVQTLDERFGQAVIVALGGLVMMCLLALLGVRHLTRRVTRIATAMTELAEARHDPPPLPEIEAMSRQERNAFGALAGAVMTFRQALLDEHQVRAELLAQQQSLEAQVEARTADLREARDQAEAATRVKSDFLSTMSHEIRTPMNSVIGMTHLTLRANPEPRVADCLRKIQASGQHLLGIINDILDYSKLDAHKLRLEQADFDLRELLDGLLGLVVERASAKGLALQIHVAADVPQRLRGDALRIQQVLLNYASNAIKFTDRGEIRIEVSRFDAGQDRLCLKFAVRDTGIGISQAQQGRLFQSFEQADSSITRRYGGTGLGLAICKRLAELMHGQVGVDSIPGQGSTFWFTCTLEAAMPMALGGDEGADRTGGARLPPAAVAASVQSLAGLRVLLVEDNDINQEVARGLMADLGVLVDVAVHGLEALDRLKTQVYDLVLMDMQMPVMDGLTATRLIRAQEHLARLPIVAMTANAMASDRQRCLEAGMDDHLAKPVEPDELRATLLRCVRAPAG